MAGRKRSVQETNYDLLIKTAEEKIEKLTNELKEEKISLRKLKKQKEKHDKLKAEEEKEREKMEIVDMIAESGKSLDEIKELLLK